MEEKKYEAGKVEITSTEYRDLVTQAVEARSEASRERSKRWELESELKKTQEELELTRKRVCELESINEALRSSSKIFNVPSYPQQLFDQTRPYGTEVTCNSNHTNAKEDI